MNNAQMVVALLLEPRSFFIALRDRPTFWFPLLLFTLSSVAALVLYFSVVDFAWLADHIIDGDSHVDKLSQQQKAEFASTMSRDVMMWTSLTAMVVGIPVVRLLEGAYYFLAGKATAVSQSFRHWLALASWSGLPIVLILLVSIMFLMMHPNGQVTQEQLNVLSLNELFFHLPPESRWYSLMSSLTVLHPWAWWLAAVGVNAWSERSMAFSVVFSQLLWVVFYGTWALIVLL